MNKNEFFNIAGKYAEGSCSKVEMDVITSFCEKVQMEEVSTNWSLSKEEQIQMDLMKKISSTIDEFEAAPTHQKQNEIGFTNFWKAAAAIALIVGISFVFFFLSQKTERVQDNQLAFEQVIKTNPNGIKSHIKLPDGTDVWLNAASSISYSPGFTDTARLVNLEGEAYFEVVKDNSRPFRVTSGSVVTTALGTSFNIKANEDENIKVSLSTGKVSVTRMDNNEFVILQPGQQAKADGSNLSITEFENEIVLAWKDGTIYFDDTEFDEMITVLEKWYDVKFSVQNLSDEKKKSLKVTGKYPNLSLKNILDILSYSLEFEYKITNKTVTIKF